jgi:hypothetical protein
VTSYEDYVKEMELQLANRTIYVHDMAPFQPMGFGIHTAITELSQL